MLRYLVLGLGALVACALPARADEAPLRIAIFQADVTPPLGAPLCDALVQQGGPMGLLPASPRESLLPLELEDALQQRGPVMMEYLDADQNRTQRVVEPIEIRRRSGELILIAHCRLRNDRRNFKLERIVRLTRITELQPS